MSASITLKTRISESKKYIDDNFNPLTKGNYAHFYTGRTKPWNNEYSPDLSTSSGSEMFDHIFQRIFLKSISKDNTILAIKRFNWIKDTIYTRADYNVDYTDYRNWVHPESPFYVINSEGNVYKCISNNNNGDSTIEPTGQSTGYTNLGDGYIWKFMFGLTTPINDKFLTDTWIPVPHEEINKSFSQVNVKLNAVNGDIAYIHLDNNGTGYTTPPIIDIRGDGSGAQAIAVMNGEYIDHIQVSNAGSGYTHAEVKIFGNGVDAKATAMISPNGGHGYDANYELGSFYVEIVSDIIGNEDNIAPTNGTYRNIGIVLNTKNKDGEIITDEKCNTLSIINIINSSGTYLNNELVIGEDSYAQGVIYNDPTGINKDLVMYMIEGSFINGEQLHGQESGIVGEYVESASTYTNVDIQSGDIIYKENIIFITRREIQTEKFIFTIEF